MRIAIEHRTRYRFTEPQARIVQMLRLTPRDTRDQTIVSWDVGVDCDARLRQGADGFGNAISMLYAEGPIEELALTVTGEVLTIEANGVLRDGSEPLPPALYLRVTARTRASVEIAEFAAGARAGDTLERLHLINAALNQRFPCIPDALDRGCTAAEAFARGTPTSRDAAQMFVAAARSIAVPARYVSGYRADGGAQGAPHAWAEAFVDGIGWIGFDPATGLSPDESYVRVAVGLDASGAAPIVGMRIGHGDEQLDVDLQAEPIGGDA